MYTPNDKLPSVYRNVSSYVLCLGPRCFTMMEGSRREALDTILHLSTVVLMTEVRGRVCVCVSVCVCLCLCAAVLPLLRTMCGVRCCLCTDVGEDCV
jgi:hypothetical protein